jgi:ABC-type Mn2+/Zn2+ transport system ATPase subunit
MEWINKHLPHVRIVDQSTFERYEVPAEVQEFIKTTWTKQEETYHKPNVQLNQTAFHILDTKGTDAAAKHMMSMSGNDYARMRMEFG